MNGLHEKELQERIEVAVERGNQPIWKVPIAEALSEGVQSVPNSSPLTGTQKTRVDWWCDYCNRLHHTQKRPAKQWQQRGGERVAFCRTLGAEVYSREALIMQQPPNRLVEALQ